jgi:thiol-disulfide isomerase/thioredoxin
MMQPLTDDETGEDKSYFLTSRNVTELSSSDFEQVATWRLKSKKCTAVLFYADWCPHCKVLKDVWEDLGKKAAFFEVAAFNCARHQGHTAKIKADMPGLIGGYPTIVFYVKGEPKEAYDGERVVGKLLKKCMAVCSKDG